MFHTERVRQLMYANSPYNLGSKNDNIWRDAIDETLEAIELDEINNISEHVYA